ncbi:MAG TPA: phosphatase [Gammaproteobacteria bacterium]
MSAAEVGARFTKLGGVLVTPPEAIAERLARVRALVFDWDGVFNAGAKGEGAASTFTEADSMGTNLLRYALWQAHGERLPYCAVITGVDNPSAKSFVVREHFHALLYNVKDKGAALADVCAREGLEPREVACVFDDVNDLAMAAVCGVRVLVRRDASPLLLDYAVRHGLADYVTGRPAERGAVREATELLLGLAGAFERVVASRIAFDADYRRYFDMRQAQRAELLDRGPR